MKRKSGYKMIIFAIMVSLSAMFLLAGCDNKGDKHIVLAVVGSPHSNEPAFPISAASIKEKIYDCCYTYGSVSFVSVSANPKVEYQADIPKPSKSGLSDNKKKSIAEYYADTLLKELNKIRSEIPEVDTLKAITLAAKSMSENNNETDKIMVIMDNGLSTIGYLDFTKNNLFEADTEDIVNALKEVQAIPNVRDISVIWMYIGQTWAPQEELSEAQKHKLEEIWKAVLEEGGAKSISFTNDISSEETDSDLPYVSLVDVQERKIEVKTEENKTVELIVKEPIKTVVLDNTSVRFAGDKAEFVDYNETVKALEEYADLLLKYPDNKVFIIGTTATGSEEFCKSLSTARANAVRQVLISYGVPESQMIPIGMAYADPWHKPDLDENGRQIEQYACQNRKVLIVDVNGEDAKKIS